MHFFQQMCEKVCNRYEEEEQMDIKEQINKVVEEISKNPTLFDCSERLEIP